MNNLNFDQLFKKYDYLVFFDTETTGLDPERDHITELAAIKVVKEEEQGRVTNIISSLLKLPEGVVIPEFLEKLTGITNEVIREEGRDWSEVYEEFTTLFEKDKKGLVIAYNAQFDLMFMQHQFLAFKELDPLDFVSVFFVLELLDDLLEEAFASSFLVVAVADAVLVFLVSSFFSVFSSFFASSLVSVFSSETSSFAASSFFTSASELFSSSAVSFFVSVTDASCSF